MRLLNCGCAVVLVAGISSQMIAPTCPNGNSLCESYMDPVHAHGDIPSSRTYVIRGSEVLAPNVRYGIEHIRVTAKIRNP